MLCRFSPGQIFWFFTHCCRCVSRLICVCFTLPSGGGFAMGSLTLYVTPCVQCCREVEVAVIIVSVCTVDYYRVVLFISLPLVVVNISS